MTRFVTNKEAMAMAIANSYIKNYTKEDLIQYAYDRMVDELLDEPESILESKMVKLAEQEGGE